MPDIVFKGFWTKDWQDKFNIPKGYLLIKPVYTYISSLGKILNKLTEWQKKKMELRELKFKIEIHYKKRTLDQNSLMWALYFIEAHEMNGGMKGEKSVTSEYLYENDLKTHAQIIKIVIPKKQAEFIRREYRVIKEEDCGHDVFLFVMLSSSHFDTVQMAEWIEMLFNRIAENGVVITNPGQIQDYWVEWKQYLNDRKILLHEEKMSQSDYKSLNPLCEAHGSDCYIGYGGGSLHHIKARGMGGNSEESKEFPSNWLHLCDPSHLEWDDLGIEKFIKKYKHLNYKINAALHKSYGDIKCDECGYTYSNNLDLCPNCSGIGIF